jgi:hypothetical protein
MRHVLPVSTLLLIATGCVGRKPAAWRVSGAVLAPPGVANLAADHATVKTACAPGRKFTVDRADLEKRPRGWLSEWAAKCGDPGLAERVLNAVPLSAAGRIRLTSDADIRTGFFDLTPNMRLEVITATSAPMEITSVTGTDKSLQVDLTGAVPAAAGREVAWYGFEPRSGGGSRLVPIVPGATNYYTAFGPQAAYFRFFYMADQMSVVAGAPSFDKLPRALDACDKPDGPQCIAVPPKVGVNVYTRVMVNGQAVVVSSATLRTVILATKKRPEEALPTLTITKPYRGRQTPVKFDRADAAILNFQLSGDEQIRW